MEKESGLISRRGKWATFLFPFLIAPDETGEKRLSDARPKGGVRVSWVGFWSDAYGGLNAGDSRTSSERVVALLIAHRTPSPDF